MADSAVFDGIRDSKRAATRSAITRNARRLTAEHGLKGFTVEQVCGAAGISRRTFFNYFPAKEDAVLGSASDHIPDDVASAFANGGATGRGGENLSPTLLDDFVELAAEVVDRMALSRAEMLQLKRAIVRERRLLDRLVDATTEREQLLLRLLAEREGRGPDDEVLQMASAVLHLVASRAAETFFDPATTRSYRECLQAAADTLRAVLPEP